MISLIGVTVPSTFDMCVMATILVRGGQRPLELLEREGAVVVDVDPLQHRALALAQEMPGHDVGVVLHDREHDLVALADMGEAERGGDEVDRLGRRAGEDDLVGRGGVEEARARSRAPPRRRRSRRWRDNAGRDARWHIRVS